MLVIIFQKHSAYPVHINFFFANFPYYFQESFLGIVQKVGKKI